MLETFGSAGKALAATVLSQGRCLRRIFQALYLDPKIFPETDRPNKVWAAHDTHVYDRPFKLSVIRTGRAMAYNYGQ